jgi:hypothetical protein
MSKKENVQENTEEDNLAFQAASLVYHQWWHGKMAPKIKEDSGVYLSYEEKKQEALKDTLVSIENIKQFQKNQNEDIKQNPEKYLKQFYKNNLEMKKMVATQALRIRLLEKQNEELNQRLVKELNKTILERVKEFVANIFKRGKHV